MLRSLLTTSKRESLSFEEKERGKNIAIFSLFTIAIFLAFGILYLLDGHYLVGLIETLFALLLGINLYYLTYQKTIVASARILVASVMLMSLVIFVSGGVGNTGNLWILAFPMFALLLLDTREGIAWVMAYTLLLGAVIAMHYHEILTLHFAYLELRQTLIVFGVFVFLNYFNEKIKLEARREIDAANRQIIEKDRLLMEQAKVIEIGKMMKDVSHQFQQPLNSVGLMLQNLPDDFEEGQIDKAYVDKLVGDSMFHIHYMSHTLDDFRMLFHANRGKEFITAGKIVNDTRELLATSLKGYYINFTFLDESKSDLYTIEGDLMRAFFNILNNAKDAIIARRQQGENEKIGNIIVHAKEDETHIIITVTDDAGAIPEPIMKRIFDPYYTAEFKHDARLIGLYMAKVIIEKNLGGSLMLGTQENGAVFTIKLPKATH